MTDFWTIASLVAMVVLAVAFLVWVVNGCPTPAERRPEEPVPVVSLVDARAALDAVLADGAEARRRLAGIDRNEPDLRRVASDLVQYYVTGADR